jgi:hypothetical protein
LSEIDPGDEESDDAKPAFAPVERIWDAMMNAVDDMFQQDGGGAESADEQQAARSENARSDDGGNEGQTTQDTKNASGQAASSQTGDRRQSRAVQPSQEPISQTTDVSPTRQAPSLEATSQVEGPPHATAA